MTTVLVVLTIWMVVQVPIGTCIGRWIARQR